MTTSAATEGEHNGLVSGIKRRQKHLRPWAVRHGIQCYRVYDCEDGDLPLQIDIYGNYLHVAEVEKPEAGSTIRGDGWLPEMAEVAAHTLGIQGDRVFTKLRPRRAPGKQHERRSTESFTTWVTESNLDFKVNLSDYLDTGLFLDHRITRGMVADISEGARVLNLFCYTGSFTVYAAAGGAFSTTSVDLSAPYLDWARENMNANGLLQTGIHKFEHTCAIGFLEQAVKNGRQWDVIVLDAPTFSNSTSMSRTMDIRRDHPELIRRCLSLLPREGVLVFSTNARGLYLNKRYLSDLKPKNLTNETTPEDFARTRPHRTWLFSPQ